MMEIKEADKIVISKPVATRPGFFNLNKSFSQVISGAVNPSPPAAFALTAVTVIQPATARFRSKNDTNLVGAKPLGPEASNPSIEDSRSKTVTNVVYKPIAKLVSKKTVALLANLGGRGIIHNRAECQIDWTPLVHRDLPLQPEQNMNAKLLENGNKFLDNSTDRPSEDGHSWRKYGQKQVKGSEYPRSYYKCTRPNCPVKKKVEKMLDGRVSEVVYEGNHNHSNPHEVKDPSFPNGTERVKGKSARAENLQNSKEAQNRSNIPVIEDPFKDITCNNGSVGTSNSSMALSGDCDEASGSLEAECRELKSKRMGQVNSFLRSSCMDREGSTGPTTIVQKVNDRCETAAGDMFRWRKYGQKVVKGKIYPRSYYRCMTPNCNVRKYVERISENPPNFITTYEGRHNHTIPES